MHSFVIQPDYKVIEMIDTINISIQNSRIDSKFKYPLQDYYSNCAQNGSAMTATATYTAKGLLNGLKKAGLHGPLFYYENIM